MGKLKIESKDALSYLEQGLARSSFPKNVAWVLRDLFSTTRSDSDSPTPIIREYLNGAYSVYKNYLFHIPAQLLDLPRADLQLLIMEEFDKDRQKFERLRAKFSGIESAELRRQAITEKTRIFVWQRDMGRCAICGSQEKLEYDHIIPVSKGGSSSARNIQILCEACNRAKSSNIK